MGSEWVFRCGAVWWSESGEKRKTHSDPIFAAGLWASAKSTRGAGEWSGERQLQGASTMSRTAPRAIRYIANGQRPIRATRARKAPMHA